MITTVTVWLCLITYIACDVLITVNNNGSDNDNCCVYGTCPCSSLSSALRNVSDNTVINITSELVTLNDIVGMGSGNLSNITITGNGATIMCNNTGGVYCESCSNITIMGITWYQCGRNDSKNLLQAPALNFTTVSNIQIYKCTFTKSSGCPVQMQHASHSISITECTFLANIFDFADDDIGIKLLCAGLYISSNAQSVLTINSSRFVGNGCVQNASRNTCPYFSVVIYNNFSEFDHIILGNTNFSDNSNGLVLWSGVKNAVIELININVHNSMQYGVYVAMRGGVDYSAFNIIDISSGTFVNNAYALAIDTYEDLLNLSINIDNSTFNNSPNGISQSGIEISSFANFTSVNVLNSIFYNNQNGAVRIETFSNYFLCTAARIIFIKVIIQSFSENASNSVYIHNEDVASVVIFEKVNFMSNFITRHAEIATLHIENYFTDMFCQLIANNPMSIQLTELLITTLQQIVW